MTSRTFAIPIYLNQRVVFDLLAVDQDGFSQLQSIRSSESSTEATASGVAGQIGVSNAFAFLGIGLKGGKTRDAKSATQREIFEERVFTPAALFSKLRELLVAKELLTSLDDPERMRGVLPGMFVEFSAILRKSPLVEALEGIADLGALATLFQASEPTIPSTSKKNDRRGLQQRPMSQAEAVTSMIRKLLPFITQRNTTDLLARLGDSDIKAVVPVEMEYFANGTPAAILDGQFVVLGKVVRIIPKGCGSIDLLRGTSLSRLHDDLVNQITEAFAAAGDQIRVPEIITTVDGPALQVIPIAIYA